MKKYIFLAMSAAVLGFTSCSDDSMDEANKNYKNPPAELVSAHLQITDAIMATAFATVSGDYAFYTSTLTEQEFGTGNNQLMKAELRNRSELGAASTFNNVWNSTYANLLNIKEMMDKVENGTANSVGMYDVLGAAQVLWAINFGILTDLHGDVPYTQALQGAANMTAAPDSQESIYKDIIATCDKAIENLTKGAKQKNMANVDIAYHGDASKWLAAAYAVKARYLIHQTCVDDQAAAKALEAANKAKELGFEGLLVSEFNGVTCDNPWSAFVWSRKYTAPSKTVEAPAEVGDKLEDLKFSFDGKVYQIPFAISELPSDWKMNFELDEDEKNIAAGETSYSNGYRNDKYDNSCSLYVSVSNDTDKEIPYEEGKVTSFSFNIAYCDSDNYPELILPKGITWGSNEDDIKAAYGTDYSTYDSTDGDYRILTFSLSGEGYYDTITFYVDHEDGLNNFSMSHSEY